MTVCTYRPVTSPWCLQLCAALGCVLQQRPQFCCVSQNNVERCCWLLAAVKDAILLTRTHSLSASDLPCARGGISPVGYHQKHNEIRLTLVQAAQHREREPAEQRDGCEQRGKYKKKTNKKGAVLSFTSHHKTFKVELFVKLSHCHFQ